LIAIALLIKGEYRARILAAVIVALLLMPFVAYRVGVAVGY
jgi:hypothetical protein